LARLPWQSRLPMVVFMREEMHDLSATQEGNHLADTVNILARVRAGDEDARGEILLRYQDPLTCFLGGRLPNSSHGRLDTGDLVQETLAAALRQLERFEYRGIGSFWAYLRRIGINLILQEQRRPEIPRADESECVWSVADASEAPPNSLLRKESFLATEAALARVLEPVRSALLLRLELGLSYRAIAKKCGYPSADAARMAIRRAMESLASELCAFQP
jgi:RNA polymerase sigma factor (sigma-70 family)